MYMYNVRSYMYIVHVLDYGNKLLDNSVVWDYTSVTQGDLEYLL